MDLDNLSSVSEEAILKRIYFIRGMKVMLDIDLAKLYGIPTKQLKRAVRRNKKRFPEDFMFEMTVKELNDWRSQFGTSNREKKGLRIPPFAFTEHGIIMLASVLNSDRAIEVNILVVRVFIKIRTVIGFQRDILDKIKQIEQVLIDYDEKFITIFEYLKKEEQFKIEEEEFKNRRRIGFKPD